MMIYQMKVALLKINWINRHIKIQRDSMEIKKMYKY